MSMEEEQARQAAAAAAAGGASGASGSSGPAAPAPAAASTEPAEATDDEEQDLLNKALAMSEEQDVEMEAPQEGDEDMSEEEAIAKAIEMSMRPQGEQEDGKDKK